MSRRFSGRVSICGKMVAAKILTIFVLCSVVIVFLGIIFSILSHELSLVELLTSLYRRIFYTEKQLIELELLFEEFLQAKIKVDVQSFGPWLAKGTYFSENFVPFWYDDAGYVYWKTNNGYRKSFGYTNFFLSGKPNSIVYWKKARDFRDKVDAAKQEKEDLLQLEKQVEEEINTKLKNLGRAERAL
jgi:hypothetical protein